MQMDSAQFNIIMDKMSTLEAGAAVAVVAICATLFIVGYLARFKK
jgi:hypothetical protein